MKCIDPCMFCLLSRKYKACKTITCGVLEMKWKHIVTAGLIAGLLLTTGCGNNTAPNDNNFDNTNNDFDNQLEQQRLGDAQRNNQNGYGANDGNPANNGNRNQTDNGASQRDEVEIAEEAAEKVTQLNFVRSAYVLKTANNAFVAAMLEDGDELSRHMEDQIAQAVRSVDQSVNNVYVSTNPNFLDRVDLYIDDIRQGRPVEGFVEQFGEMIDRLFPNAR